jgi:peptidyl-prolyl cis-trans isomerase-like 4
MSVLIETTAGDIVIDLYTDLCPQACTNFLKLCKLRWYNHSLVSQVQQDFLVQCGQTLKPQTSVWGAVGGEGELGNEKRWFHGECTPRLVHEFGTVSMLNVNAKEGQGPVLHGSQFFICMAPEAREVKYLNGKHTVFGRVAEGLDVLEKINECYTNKAFRPLQNIRLNHTLVLDDPIPDTAELLAALPAPDSAPPVPPFRDAFDETFIAADEAADVSSDDDDPEAHIKKIERERAKAAASSAAVLTMLNDLPDADARPPENVLFVCQLHPETQQDDLKLIFSQVGVRVRVTVDDEHVEALFYCILFCVSFS